MKNTKLFPIILIIMESFFIIFGIIGSIILKNVLMGIFITVGLAALLTISILWFKDKLYSKALPVCDLFILIGMIGSLCSTLTEISAVMNTILNMLLAFMIGVLFTSHILRIFLHNNLKAEEKTELLV